MPICFNEFRKICGSVDRWNADELNSRRKKVLPSRNPAHDLSVHLKPVSIHLFTDTNVRFWPRLCENALKNILSAYLHEEFR